MIMSTTCDEFLLLLFTTNANYKNLWKRGLTVSNWFAVSVSV